MKKIFSKTAIIAACISLTSCGFGSTSSSTTSSVLGSLASSALTGTTSSTTGSILNSVLTSLLSTKTTQSSIEGTWTYNAPKVVFESESVLAKLGSSVASSKIESTLSTQLKKIGFSAGKSTITFNSDKTCVMTLSNKTYNGTYTYDSSTSKMTITGTLGVANLSCTCTVSGSELYMLFDADKLLSVATGVAGSSSNLSTLSTLLSSYNGLKLGWAMVKN